MWDRKPSDGWPGHNRGRDVGKFGVLVPLETGECIRAAWVQRERRLEKDF